MDTTATTKYTTYGAGQTDPRTGNIIPTGRTISVPNSLNATDVVNSKSFVVPPTTPQTESAGALDYIASLNNSNKLQAQKEQDLKAKQAELQNQSTDISSLIQELGTSGSKENQAFIAEGGDIAKKESDRLTSEIEAEQLSARRKIEEIQRSNPTGALRGGQQDLINNIQRESLSKQADLAILQNAALRKYDTASSIAQRKVQAELEPLKARLDALKFLYSENKDTLTKQEDRLYQEKIKTEERAYNEELQTKKSIEAIKLEAAKNGLKDFSAFAGVTSVDEALNASKGYLSAGAYDFREVNGNLVKINKNTGAVSTINIGGGSPKTLDKTFSPLISTVSNLETSVAGKQAVKDQMEQYIKEGDMKSAYNQIANTVSSSLTGETKSRFESSRIDREVLSGFRDALQEYQDAGGDIGLLKGSAESISRKLLGVTGNPALTSMAVQLEREFQAYRNAMTGAAFTPKESREYAAVNPTAKKSFDLNFAVIDGALAQLDNRVDGTIRAKVPQATEVLGLINATNKPNVFTATVQSSNSAVYDKINGWIIPTE